MSQWYDFFKLFSYAFAKDPLSRKDDRRRLRGVGVTQPDAMPDLRNTDGFTAGSGAYIRVQNDLIDVTSTANRLNRYKEYDRFATTVPEIDMAMTVFADETCVSGDTEVATLLMGFKKIKWLAENIKNPFPVYTYDFVKKDYNVGWAVEPRLTKKSKTIKILLDNGEREITTPDHRILKIDGSWSYAADLKQGDELMPFYKLKPKLGSEKGQFDRIFTFTKGWVTEKQIVDEWKMGDLEKYEDINAFARGSVAGLSSVAIAKSMNTTIYKVNNSLKKYGITKKELGKLAHLRSCRRVVGIILGGEIDVYDLTVEGTENFCSRNLVFHNCQNDQEDRCFKIQCKNKQVREELEYLFFNRDKLNLNQMTLWDMARRFFIKGDQFWELIINPDDPRDGIQRLNVLPCENMYRIETTKGNLVEFQQSREGPDLEALVKAPVMTATQSELAMSTAIRFTPEQIVHLRLGDFRRTFYPYGVSLIEPARQPAISLQLMTDAMMVYRLSRAPERRVFYIDVGTIPAYKAESFMQRIKDLFRKKKVTRHHNNNGPNAVDERWHPPAVDEDIWVPVRPNSATRIDTLPGACLSLDTKIPLLDGRVLTLNEIINEYEDGKRNGKNLWAYSCDPISGKIAPGLISWAGITRKNTEVVRVHLDNGKSIVCTPDHNFPVQGKKEKIQAKDLKPGDNLFPFKSRIKTFVDNKKYLQVYDFYKKDWDFTHQTMARFVLDTLFEQKIVYNPEYKENVAGVVRHIDGNHINNNPDNLAWVNWEDYQEHHKTCFEKVNNTCVENKTNNNVFNKKTDFYETDFDNKINKKSIFNRNKNINNYKFIFPEIIWDSLVKNIKNGKSIKEFLSEINKQKDVLKEFILLNKINKIKFNGKFTLFHIKNLVKNKGYKCIKNFKRDFNNCNCKVVKVEFIDERIDTGTLTIDRDHLVHNFHTFAVDAGVNVYNSNLGEIDDCVYFRNRLFIALHFPPNYFAAEDVAVTRISLSAQDARFSRLIERLQSYIKEGLYSVAHRHLHLLGVPEEEYRDLKIPFTPPSEWRELSRAEIMNNRIQYATALKSSGLMADIDILELIMKYTKDEAEDMVNRNKIQQMETIKIQLLGQNPDLLGIGIPGQGEEEIGAVPGGPSPLLGGQQQTDQQQTDQTEPDINQADQEELNINQSQPKKEKSGQERPLPEPSPEDIIRFDLEIKDYETGSDYEDVDYSEIE